MDQSRSNPPGRAFEPVPALARQTDTADRRGDAPAITKGAPPAGASESPAPIEQREWFGNGLKWWNWSRMTGDWDRLRTDLEDRGLSFQISNISDVSNLAAGSARPQKFGRQLTSIGLTLDLEKIAGLTCSSSGTRAGTPDAG